MSERHLNEVRHLLVKCGKREYNQYNLGLYCVEMMPDEDKNVLVGKYKRKEDVLNKLNELNALEIDYFRKIDVIRILTTIASKINVPFKIRFE